MHTGGEGLCYSSAYDDLNRICIKLDYCNVSLKLIFYNNIFFFFERGMRTGGGFDSSHIQLSSFHQ